MIYLLDTSGLVRLLRDQRPQSAWYDAIDADAIASCFVQRTDFLYGTRSGREYGEIAEMLSDFYPDAAVPKNVGRWISAVQHRMAQAGEVGREPWETLRGLMRRDPADGATGSPRSTTGEAELTALSEAPQDMERAQALSEALSRLAERYPSFWADLMRWQRQAQMPRSGDGDTSNVVSCGRQNGPVVQGRDFSEINFNSPGQGWHAPPPSTDR